MKSTRPQIIDARSADRFFGRVSEPRSGLRSGHIPGSKNVCYKELLNPDKTLKKLDEMKDIFLTKGVDFSKPVITTCGSGVTAAILYLALHLLGHVSLSLYDGSWSEWGAMPDLPVDVN